MRAEPLAEAERIAATLAEVERVSVVGRPAPVTADLAAAAAIDGALVRWDRGQRGLVPRARLARGGVPRADPGGSGRAERDGQHRRRAVVQRKRASTWILLGVFAALSVFFLYVLPSTDEVTTDLLPEDVAGNVARIFPVLAASSR